MVTRLPIGRCAIVIQRATGPVLGDWSDVALVDEHGTPTRLGAESERTILLHLCSAVCGPRDETRFVARSDVDLVYHALSLAEVHSSLYLRFNPASDRVAGVAIESGDGAMVFSAQLGDEDLRAWTEALRRPSWAWRWIEAGKTLAGDPAATVLCPVCAAGNLEVEDVENPRNTMEIERYLRCPICLAVNILRMTRSASTGEFTQ